MQDAKAVEAEVNAYKATFETFQKLLDARTKDVAEGRKNLTELWSATQSQRRQVEDLISRSEKMLSLTTTAGLAAHYLRKVQDLTKDVFWARISFYIGIAFLFVSAIPIFAQTILPLLMALNPSFGSKFQSMFQPPADTWRYALQTFGRLILLVPAALLVRFGSKRHASLFKLREQYAHKYALVGILCRGIQKGSAKIWRRDRI